MPIILAFERLRLEFKASLGYIGNLAKEKKERRGGWKKGRKVIKKEREKGKGREGKEEGKKERNLKRKEGGKEG
jgi:hypothetical protein